MPLEGETLLVIKLIWEPMEPIVLLPALEPIVNVFPQFLLGLARQFVESRFSVKFGRPDQEANTAPIEIETGRLAIDIRFWGHLALNTILV